MPARSVLMSEPTNCPERWLLLSNCQAIGLANCLTLLNTDLQVDAYDPVAYSREAKAIAGRLDAYDRIIVAPAIEKTLDLALGESDRVWRLPTFNFTGFHPDHCNLIVDGSWTGGPLSGNFSALCYAAYAHGLKPGKALELFCDEVYRQAGYLGQWPLLRAGFIERFSNYGFDISRIFVEWSRSAGGFAYVPSHPKIECLDGMARLLLERAGLPAERCNFLPHDNLANGVVFPVYPGIASSLGVDGNFHFKPARQYRHIGLEQFVTESYAFFEQSKTIVVPAAWQAQIARIGEVLRG